MNISEIKPYAKNAKKHPEHQIKILMKDIEAFGFTFPMIIDKDHVIVSGHARIEAAKRLGYEEVKIGALYSKPGEMFVPAILNDYLNEDQIRQFRIADNKTNESPWIKEVLMEELREIHLKGLDLTLTGFSVDLIRDMEEDGFDAEAEYEKIKSPKSKKGDLYQLGEHRLMCGDSTSEKDFKKLLGREQAKLIFTDPPYNVDYKSPSNLSYDSKKYGGSGGKIFNDNLSDNDCLDFYTKVLNNLYDFSADETTIYWWFANINNHINREAFKNAKWHMSQIIIWLKNSMVLSMGQDYHRCYEPCMVGWKKGKKHQVNKAITNYTDMILLDYENFGEMLDVWYEKRDSVLTYVHPTQKPIRLAEKALKRNSLDGDIVLDVFGGSGSTMMACEQLKRRCFSMELDPKYVDVIIKRWEKYTGKKAKKAEKKGGVKK